MATHSKLVDPSNSGIMQIFSNDTSLSDAYTFANGDYIDIESSLKRAGKKVLIIVRGTMDVTFSINPTFTIPKFNESQANDSIEVSENLTGINQLRLSSTGTGTESFEFPIEFPIRKLKITAYSGTASSANNITIIAF